MIAENRALPLISPVARYDPPTICLDKDESLADEDLNNGPGMDELGVKNPSKNLLLKSLFWLPVKTINDVLDKLEIGERKPRRDTNIFHAEILVSNGLNNSFLYSLGKYKETSAAKAPSENE